MSTLQKPCPVKNSIHGRKDARPESQSMDRVLDKALESIHAVVPPLWPLADYVAVNPFFGLVDQPFLQVASNLRNIRPCNLLMPRSYFKSLLQQGLLSDKEVQMAHSQCVTEHPEWHGSLSLADLNNWLGQPEAPPPETRCRTFADRLDQQEGSAWASHITNDITRHCSAHFDEGQAGWPSPWRMDSLYIAWKKAAGISRRMDLLGLRGFRQMVRTLPDEPQEAIQRLLQRLGVPQGSWKHVLLAQAFSVPGWASYIRYRVRQDEASGRSNPDLNGLVAMRLAYDVALREARGMGISDRFLLEDAPTMERIGGLPSPPVDLVARHVLQVAIENVYRKQLLSQLTVEKTPRAPDAPKKLQMVFCIDVRSEVFRRHLESVDASIETFGFAGFFGMSMEYRSLGSEKGLAQCPVLLQPAFTIQEKPLGADAHDCEAIHRRQVSKTENQSLWQRFQSSATACFSYVESLGLGFFAKLARDSFRASVARLGWPADSGNQARGHRLGPEIRQDGPCGLPETSRIDLAENLLRNLGLLDGFAPLVVLCGHASEVTNNPYRAALDCGACGGHSGEPNARVAAALLNDETVRQGLLKRNIRIPAETWFTAAVHNTTTDEVNLCDPQLIPTIHSALVAEINGWFRMAGKEARQERCSRLGERDGSDILRRSRDWSEVRPEWGLAGNAALIVAPRSRTKGLDLGGRTFLHSYDHRLDPDLRVLELIMTAPMVVANWINLQYYASTVDQEAFGSGNKLIHNVVGRFGVLQGNGGDLMTGLPMQCVQDGNGLQHEPLRLVVVIEAPKDSVEQIIQKHGVVRNLVSNGWVTLIVLDAGQKYRWTPRGAWIET